jgi:ABC-type Zn uptake system ZnuABC Zn-binding protein ZnuA
LDLREDYIERKRRGQEIMSNHDKVLQARIDIETAAEISHATISEVMDNIDDDRYKYILLGVLQQQEGITRALETINEALKAEREKAA